MDDEIKTIICEFESLFEISEAPEHILDDFKRIKDCINDLENRFHIANEQSEENYEKYTNALKNINQLKDSIRRLTKSRNKFRKKYYKLLNGEQDGKR